MTPPATRGRRTTWPAFVDGAWPETHRLIPATYADRSEPWLARLVDDDADIALLTELAAATNTRLAAQRDRSTLAIGADELVFRVEHAHIVNAAFCYPGQGARFSDRTRGAWYCATDIETCLAEVVHHRRLHLAETDWWHDTLDYQDYTCSVGGPWFADLRDGSPRARRCLDPDSYVVSQALAADLLEREAAGVVYPSVRREGGTCIACFRPALLPPVGTGGRHRIRFTGTPDPEITALP